VRRPAALGCLATVLAADWVILRRSPRWIVSGLFDEPAHLATGGLVLLNLPPRSGAWSAGFLAGSVLPDIDHVPLALQEEHPALTDPRPVTHCLAAVVPLLAGARLTRSEALVGAAAGSLTHLARDLAVGTGAPLLQPLSARVFRLPYPLYAATLGVLALRAIRR
jgi:inner membrane protein